MSRRASGTRKHVKAIFQVGEDRSSAFSHRLGYPIEIIPHENPYSLTVGDSLHVTVLLHDQPLGEQLVYASHSAHHSHTADGAHN